MKNYFEAFTIPYWQTKVIDWEYKKKSLLSLHYNNKHNMCGGDEQYTDYNSKNSYHSQVQSILLDDLYSLNMTIMNMNLQDLYVHLIVILIMI